MKILLDLTHTGALMAAEALESEASSNHVANNGLPTPRGQYLFFIARQIRAQAEPLAKRSNGHSTACDCRECEQLTVNAHYRRVDESDQG